MLLEVDKRAAILLKDHCVYIRNFLENSVLPDEWKDPYSLTVRVQNNPCIEYDLFRTYRALPSAYVARHQFLDILWHHWACYGRGNVNGECMTTRALYIAGLEVSNGIDPPVRITCTWMGKKYHL